MKVIELTSEQREELKRRVPKHCPFCKDIDDADWFEFRVMMADPMYVEADEQNAAYQSNEPLETHVFCTRCKEEVREEDVR